MKRYAFKLPLFLLIGAIINVAVAWACVIAMPIGNSLVISNSHRVPTSSEIERWREHRPRRFSKEPATAHQVDYFGWRTTHFYGDLEGRLTPTDDGGFRIAVIGQSDRIESNLEIQAGWPWHAFRGFEWNQEHWTATKTRIATTRQSLCRWPWHFAALPATWLPYAPMWPGFAINTIFYAAIVSALFTVPGAVRRRVRIKRGQCASCGYSLRDITSEKCPECGAATQRLMAK